MKKIISVAAGAALTTMFVIGYSSPAFAPADMFIKIDGIEGESSDRAHKDEIDVISWSWGEASTTRSVGERVMQPEMGAGVLTVTRSVDKATPLLMNYCATGKPLATVLVIQGAETYKLSEVSMRCASNSGATGDTPTEEVAFYYNKITFSYDKGRKDKKKDKYNIKEKE